jgi:hypothetical protein
MEAAIRFCEVMFGPDYASLMSKAAEMAKPVERKAAEAGSPPSSPAPVDLAQGRPPPVRLYSSTAILARMVKLGL